MPINGTTLILGRGSAQMCLTGYQKPAAAAPITASDSINAALGKLEAGKAPAGYGLGTQAATVTDWNDITECGDYKACGAANSPDENWWYGHVTHGDGVLQSLCSNSGVQVQRIKNDTTWGPWEYVNPPMALGVEYRTTERYLSKPVYAKVLDCGAFPSSGSRSVSITLDNADQIVRSTGVLVNEGLPLPWGYDGSHLQEYFITSKTNIYLRSVTPGFIYSPAYITIYYTKTTD